MEVIMSDFNFSFKNKDLGEKETATSGSLTAEIIAEARQLAESRKGLDIEKFITKHRLRTFDIEQILHAPLKEDGTIA